jgi:glycosyltransferase involved in cell wall biosynthesis
MHLMMQFALHGRSVLWVNPIPFRGPSLNEGSKKSWRVRAWNKLLTHLRIFSRQRAGVYVLVPVYFPLFTPFWDCVNRRLVGLQVRLVALLLGIDFASSVLWITGSFTLQELLKLQFATCVYYAADLVSAFPSDRKALSEVLRRDEAWVCRNADLVLAASPNIALGIKRLSGITALMVPHGVDYNHFAAPRQLATRMLTIKARGLPIAGYFGSLTDANDKSTYEALSRNGFSVVLIGRRLGDYSALEKTANIYFLGPVLYEHLPSFGQAFDVCIMSWIPSGWIQNCLPIKTLEYLAMGKPVISCPIPAVSSMCGDLVTFASEDGFVAAAVTALRSDSSTRQDRRREFARGHSWSERFRSVTSLLQECHRSGNAVT